MKNDLRGVYASELRGATVALPDDVGDVHDPGNTWQCWAVVGLDKTTRVRKPKQCCNAHRNGSKMCARHRGRKA